MSWNSYRVRLLLDPCLGQGRKVKTDIYEFKFMYDPGYLLFRGCKLRKINYPVPSSFVMLFTYFSL